MDAMCYQEEGEQLRVLDQVCALYWHFHVIYATLTLSSLIIIKDLLFSIKSDFPDVICMQLHIALRVSMGG